MKSVAFMKSAAFLLIAVAAGCSNQEPVSAPNPRLGQPFFGFDHQTVTEFMISKSDPANSIHWSARLVKTAPDRWEIHSDAELGTMSDRLANEGYIEHLLDTLRTFHPTVEAPRGPKASFGLVPPRFALQWTTPSGQSQIWIGAALGEQAYCIAPSLENTKIYICEGAALAMLDHAVTLNSLRRTTLSTLTSDDVDEIELKRGHPLKRILYAQRDRGEWTDAHHRKLKIDAGAVLDGITHLVIADFVDDDARTKDALQAIKKDAYSEVVLSDRKGRKIFIRVALVAGSGGTDRKLMATISSRSGAVFELHSEGLRFFAEEFK